MKISRRLLRKLKLIYEPILNIEAEKEYASWCMYFDGGRERLWKRNGGILISRQVLTS